MTRCLNNPTLHDNAQGKYPEAELLVKRALAIREKSLGHGGATPSATGTAFGWGFHYRRAVYRQRAIRKENEYADLEA